MRVKTWETVIEGFGNLPSGQHTAVLVEGIGKANGPVVFERLRVDGCFHAKDRLEGEEMIIEGKLNCDRDVQVQNFHLLGMMSVTGNVKGAAMLIGGFLKCSGEVSGDRIQVDGVIQADRIVAGEVYFNDQNYQNPFRQRWAQSKVNQIDCTTCHGAQLCCHKLCGDNIDLRSHCVIDIVECNGTIRMDSTCKVKEMKGDYTLHAADR